MDPLGTWELDPSTLDYRHGRPGRRAIYVIEATADGLQFHLDADDPDGKPMRFTYGGRLDGSEIPLGPSTALALTRRDDRTIESAVKKNGVVVDRWIRELAEDGQSMTIVQHVMTADGRVLRNSGVYRKRRLER